MSRHDDIVSKDFQVNSLLIIISKFLISVLKSINICMISLVNESMRFKLQRVFCGSHRYKFKIFLCLYKAIFICNSQFVSS